MISRIADQLTLVSQEAQMEFLRKLPGIQISLSFILGKYSEIIIKGENNKLLISDRVRCKKNCNFLIYPKANLIIKSGVFFNNYCSITCLGNIEIGENTLFGEGVKLYDHNHNHKYIDGLLKVDPDEYKIGFIKIGENCWIGSNVTVLKNVEIGNNVIVGANCLIYKSIPANTIVRSTSTVEHIEYS